MESVYYSLATKNNFNKALRHFYKVTDIVDELDSGKNLADLIWEEIDEESIASSQILPIIGATIRDKYNYSYDSYDVLKTVSDFSKIAEETFKWTALDIVLVYYNSSGKVILLNPKNSEQWDRARELTKGQLVIIYAKALKEEDSKIEKEAISAIEEMLSGKDVFINKDFIDQTIVPKVAKKQVSTNKKIKRKVTSKYGVQVSNELFHNGNVEAWKKIVESYNAKYPDLEVFIYFEGEVINDINSLFKWGKVKHGDSIFFQVAGENIIGVSKLMKYFYEGASPRYEQFLKIAVGQVLNLF